MALHNFVFILITSAVKLVHIFMERNRVSKSFLMAELCFYRYVHRALYIDYMYCTKRSY